MNEPVAVAALDGWRAQLEAITDWDEWMAAAVAAITEDRAAEAEIAGEFELAEGDAEALADAVAEAKRPKAIDLVALARAHKAAAEAVPVAEAEPAPSVPPPAAPEIVEPAPLPVPTPERAPVWADPDVGEEIDWRAGGRSLQNAKVAIAKLGIRCQFDDFHKKYMVHGHPCMKGGSVSECLDNMALMVRNEISKVYKLDIAKGLVMEALQIKCMERAFDPVRDYLDELRWDGQPRLDRWLVTHCGADDTEYVRAVGRKVLLAAVRRAREPGCKFDYLMVMEGRQGAGKSTALRILAGTENFSDAQVLRLRDKEQQEAIGGIWIYEIAELAGRHIDVEGLKAFLSKTVDAARAAYGHGRTDQRRRCIFVATTNNDQYLKDGTGNRRFWPVRVGEIDLEALRLDRDQLWAEAAAAEATGEPLVIPAALWSVAAGETAGRMELDPWADIVGDKLAQLEAIALKGKALPTKLFAQGEDADGPNWRVASDYLLSEVLGIQKARQSNWQTKRLANAMRSLGWAWCENPMRFGSAGQKRGFVKPIEDAC
ncbi:virulence-associated E family protein [uncultured Bradyrhizobium sp.]|jgi:predicted P-loop ATPase|uniref:virulence-associated E family protein n=1 Tax=uncultured Bradyrhizobium sp. TaxID=199684 RepID=UPI0026178E70|nr:virulence-associated E family protein [uncultured Bradyrhizobium sp.]